MPILSPSGILQFAISDLLPEVVARVENQNQISQQSRVQIWIRDALLEISGNTDYRDDFDALEEIGPLVNLTGGTITTAVQEYPFSTFVPTGDYNLGTLDVMLWTNPPQNTVRKKLTPTHYQEVDKNQQVPSIPSNWYRFADTLGFDPPPNLNYQVQIRLLRRHPINDVTLGNTVILLPREWNEVIIWSAVMRGYMELLEFEKAAEIRTMLYGDPRHPDMAGLVYSVKKRRNVEAWREQQSLRPVVRGSCWGSQ